MDLRTPPGMSEAGKRLADLLDRVPRETPALVPLAPAPAPRRVVAVDGSNATLAEVGDLLVGAFRHGRVTLEDGVQVPADAAPPEVVLLSPDSAHHVLAERLRWAGVASDVPPLEPEPALHALRTLAEMAAAREALHALGRGDLLLLDGALTGRAALPVLDKLLAEARERGVDVVGVCKSTSLRIGPAPALVACRRAGRGLASPTWIAPLPQPPLLRGRAWAARLSAGEERVFRFDVAAASGDDARVLSGLAGLAGHPAYPGYPSPLAMAHNAALIPEETRRRLRGMLLDAVRDAGLDEGTLDAAFLDYHDVLDLGA